MPKWPVEIENLAREAVSRKPREFFGSAKSFLINLYLKTENSFRLKLLAWRKPHSKDSKNTLIKKIRNHKVWYFATAFGIFRVRKRLGTMEKRALSPSVLASQLTPQNPKIPLPFVIEIHVSRPCFHQRSRIKEVKFRIPHPAKPTFIRIFFSMYFIYACLCQYTFV